MRNTRIITWSLLLLFMFSGLIYAQPCKEVVAYYPNWQWYDRAQLVNPQTIDYSKYTIINYAFFKPMPDGSIAQTDSWADENLLFGQHDWVNGGYVPNTSLIDLAHNHNVKVLPSIGGWTLSDNFPAIAADSVKRANFASACVQLINTYNFDGIDLDWEYPGYAPHNGTAADGTNFTLMLGQIRDSIDALGIINGKDYLLSSCFSADHTKMAIIEWNNINAFIDMYNLMTYDFFGAFSPLSNHNAPLYAPAVGDSTFNVDSAFKKLTQYYNVPPTKVNIGVPFYGRSIANCSGLYQTHGGYADATTFWEDDGSPTYYNILLKMNQFTKYWDSLASVPYLLGNSINTFVSYDDKESIGRKAEYVVNHNAGGVIIWELTGDYIEGSSGIVAETPLVDTLNQVLCSVITQISEELTETDLEIYPNPIKRNKTLSIKLGNSQEYPVELRIINSLGKEILLRNFESGRHISIALNNLQSGVYYVSVEYEGKLSYRKLIVI